MTIGETWIEYMGVPGEYPGFMDLAHGVSDAMWDAAADILRGQVAADPVLRAMLDDRYRLWEPVELRAGMVPVGITIQVRERNAVFNAVVREPTGWERRSQPDWVHVTWEKDNDGYGRPIRMPQLRRGSTVRAWLPVPLDVSALIAVVSAECGPATRRRAAPRPRGIDWSAYGPCSRRGCGAGSGRPCVDLRCASASWTSAGPRRTSNRPHPGRPRTSHPRP